MKPLVIDASVALNWFTEEQGHAGDARDPGERRGAHRP